MLYDLGLLNLNRHYVVTLDKKKEQDSFLRLFPEFRKHVKAFKSERSQIERAFGMILRKWSILAKPFRGRGKRYLRLGQIVLLGCQLTNLVFALEETQKQKSNMVNLDPPKTFSDILDRLM